MKSGGIRAALCLCAGLACAGGPVAAQEVPALELAPITLNLTRGKPGVLYIADRGTAPVTVQIEAYAWSQAGGVDRLTPTDSLLVSPPLTHIAPGERQIVRVLADGPSQKGETSYRLLISQLPTGTAPSAQVKVLLQFSLPVFVGDATAQPAVLDWRARTGDDGITLTAHNSGGKAAKLVGLHVAAMRTVLAPKGSTSIAYILSGANHIWHLPVSGTLPAALSVSAKDERSGAAFAADVPVER